MIQTALVPVITRLAPELKTELARLAKRHGRSVAAETRHALNLWCTANMEALAPAPASRRTMPQGSR